MNTLEESEKLKKKIEVILNPIFSAYNKSDKEYKDLLFSVTRIDSGRSLPPYYLIYFLFIDFLGYRNLGQFEKTSWSIPIDYNGTLYLLEHRKLGMGLFAADKKTQEKECKEIVKKISKAVNAAQPYFEWIANETAKRSDLNVLNHSLRLHDRYLFLTNEYKQKIQEAKIRQNEVVRTQHSENSWSIEIPYLRLKSEAEWLAISAIDAFYSFTEHVFIHSAILKGLLGSGEDVANLACQDWGSKFKLCLDITDEIIKKHYDELFSIKRQIRNYIAHGAFGKNGEAFEIHSGAGAVPLLMPNKKGKSRFSIQDGIAFNEGEAIQAIDEFMKFYWESNFLPEIIYIQSSLPTILPYVSDGTYANAMTSVIKMENLVQCLLEMHDRAANMDW